MNDYQRRLKQDREELHIAAQIQLSEKFVSLLLDCPQIVRVVKLPALLHRFQEVKNRIDFQDLILEYIAKIGGEKVYEEISQNAEV